MLDSQFAKPSKSLAITCLAFRPSLPVLAHQIRPLNSPYSDSNGDTQNPPLQEPESGRIQASKHAQISKGKRKSNRRLNYLRRFALSAGACLSPSSNSVRLLLTLHMTNESVVSRDLPLPYLLLRESSSTAFSVLPSTLFDSP